MPTSNTPKGVCFTTKAMILNITFGYVFSFQNTQTSVKGCLGVRSQPIFFSGVRYFLSSINLINFLPNIAFTTFTNISAKRKDITSMFEERCNPFLLLTPLTKIKTKGFAFLASLISLPKRKAKQTLVLSLRSKERKSLRFYFCQGFGTPQKG